MTQSKFKLTNVSSKYGAPMGRPNILPEDTSLPIALTLERLEWQDGDYDTGGAYWGGNGQGRDKEYIFVAHGEETEIYIRAKTASQAMTEAKKSLPGATFPGGISLSLFSSYYVESMLWAESPHEFEGEETDQSFQDLGFGATDIAPESLAKIEADCQNFIDMAGATIRAAGLLIYESAHDFWLTRNGHGAGFWDRGLPGNTGDELTKLAKSFGSCDVYLGDDGKIYVS